MTGPDLLTYLTGLAIEAGADPERARERMAQAAQVLTIDQALDVEAAARAAYLDAADSADASIALLCPEGGPFDGASDARVRHCLADHATRMRARALLGGVT